MTTRVSNLTRERRELKRCEEVFQSAAAGESMPAKFCGTINATTESVIVRARAGTRVLLPPYRTPESLQRPISGLSFGLGASHLFCFGKHLKATPSRKGIQGFGVSHFARRYRSESSQHSGIGFRDHRVQGRIQLSLRFGNLMPKLLGCLSS